MTGLGQLVTQILTGEPSAPTHPRQSRGLRQRQILEILARGPATHCDVALELGMNRFNATRELRRLEAKGEAHVCGRASTPMGKFVVPLWAIGIGESQPDRAAVYPSILDLMA